MQHHVRDSIRVYINPFAGQLEMDANQCIARIQRSYGRNLWQETQRASRNHKGRQNTVWLSEARQGKCNRALREPRRASLGTKIASLMLTLPLYTTAHPLPTFASPLLTLAHPALPIKQPCSPFRTETDFVQVRVQVKQPAVIAYVSKSWSYGNSVV